MRLCHESTYRANHTARPLERNVGLMPITPDQFKLMELRVAKAKGIHETGREIKDACRDELKLHGEIIKWCNSQHPRVKYIRSRPDQESAIALGAQDFTLFLSGGRLLLIEVKSKEGKWSNDQLAWKLEMEKLGHTVHECRSFDRFIDLVNIKATDHEQ